MNIVIIGGSRGIGKAAARELLQDGNNVLIVGRNPKTLEETGKELAGAATYSCDAGKAEETTGLVDAVKNGKIAGFGDNVDGLDPVCGGISQSGHEDIRSTAGAGRTAGNA